MPGHQDGLVEAKKGSNDGNGKVLSSRHNLGQVTGQQNNGVKESRVRGGNQDRRLKARGPLASNSNPEETQQEKEQAAEAQHPMMAHSLPPSGNWLLKLLLSKTSYLQPGKGPEEKEDDKGQKHSDGGQQCPQEAELQRVGEKAISGL